MLELLDLLKGLRKPLWKAPITLGSKEHTAMALMWQAADKICELRDKNKELELRLLKGVVDSDLLKTYDGSALERADKYIEQLEDELSRYHALGTVEELGRLKFCSECRIMLTQKALCCYGCKSNSEEATHEQNG